MGARPGASPSGPREGEGRCRAHRRGGRVNLFAFGLGYSAQHFVRHYRQRFVDVVGTVTSAESAAALASEGIRTLLFDGEEAGPEVAAMLADTDCLLVSIPPDERGDPV